MIKSLKSIYNSVINEHPKLTQREIDVILQIAKGLNSKLIAKKLNISSSTIETHRKNIRKKLRLKGKNSLLIFSIIYSFQVKELNKKQ